jgi:DNA polymerase I-like protein with 3'-5' exonuclease and polymerase domains/site-specific DNA-adenine methylase
LDDLRSRGVKLTARGDRLHLDAPKGVLTPDLVGRVRLHKLELLQLLAARGVDDPAAVPLPADEPLGAHRLDGPAAEHLPAHEQVDHVLHAEVHHQLQVTISGIVYTYSTRWKSEVLACPTDFMAFDCETDASTDPHRHIQKLALASASDGTTHTLIHPDDLARFILAHRGVHWVAHNSSFDFWVVEQHLRRQGEQEALAAWWAAAEDNRLHDSMLLDGLLRLARDDTFPRPHDLGTLAQEYAGLQIDKSDPYRRRYGEIINKPWDTVERGFFHYAIADAIATWHTYQEIRRRALAVTDAFARVDRDVLEDAREKYGLLSEGVQVKKAIGLAAIQRNGMALDRRRLAAGEADLRRRLAGAVAEVRAACPGLYQTDKDGKLVLTNTGASSRSRKVLDDTLERVAGELRQQGLEVSVPLTAKTRKPQASRETWLEYADHHPFLRPWLASEGLAKELSFYAGLREDRVHPRYATMVRTGRTSCSAPNVQQIPRDGDLRQAFVAGDGHFLLEIDYRHIELTTLAAVCTHRYGRSALADVIKAGQDPHAHTAALMLGLTQEDFASWKKDPERKAAYKDARQSAKAVNFGVPGGLGARSLAGYARSTYGVVLTEDEARQKRERLLAIYPELAQYLAEDACTILARNLRADPGEVRRQWGDLHLSCARKVLVGNPKKGDGAPYKASFVAKVWNTLAALNRDPELADDLARKRPSTRLATRVCLSGVSTLTGRVRGGVSYTQCRNTPFQGLAADGAALALFELVKAGFRVVGFVHDAFLIELVDEGGYVSLARVREVERIICDAMARVLVGGIPVAVESKLARRWYKEAELIVQGDRVIPWEPEGGEPVLTDCQISPAPDGHQPHDDPAGPVPDAVVDAGRTDGTAGKPAGPAAEAPPPPAPVPDAVVTAPPPGEVRPRAAATGPDGRLAACDAEVNARLAEGAEPDAFPGGVPKPLIYYGGKSGHGSAQAGWEIGLFPRHLIYVEAYAGSLSTLFARDPADPTLWVSDQAPRRGVIEIVNDLDARLTNFYRVLRDPALARQFRRLVEYTLVSQREWQAARHHHYDGTNPVLDAWNYFVLNRQCRGGDMSSFAQPCYNRTRSDTDERASKWRRAVRSLAQAHRRLRRVVVVGVPALDLVRRYDRPDVFAYLDPPYVPQTRGAQKVYPLEMTYDDHVELVHTLLALRHAKVMLCGYGNLLYDGQLTREKGWHRRELEVADDVGGGAVKDKKVEVRWLNYDPDKRS